LWSALRDYRCAVAVHWRRRWSFVLGHIMLKLLLLAVWVVIRVLPTRRYIISPLTDVLMLVVQIR